MNKKAIFSLIMLMLLDFFSPTSSASDSMDDMASNIENNSLVGQYIEVYTSPIIKEQYTIIKDLSNETTLFRDENGTVYNSVEELIVSERPRVSISSELLKLDEGLEKAVEGGETNMTVPVIIVFVKQPANNVSIDVQSRYESKFEAITAPAKEIYEKLEQTASSEKDIAASTQEQESLSNEEMDQLNQTKMSLDQEITLMRSEILETSTPLVDAIQAPVIEKIKANGGEIGYSGKIFNSLSARVPVNYLVELSKDPAISMIYADQIEEAYLDAAIPAISASTWWSQGYTGGIWDAAVCDTGIDGTHPALSVDYAGVFHNQGKSNSAYADNPASTDDLQGHGTHCAGIIASTDATYKGAAYGLDALINAKAGWKNTAGSGSMYDSDCMAAVDWALLHAGQDADVLSYSFGGGTNTNGDTVLCHYMDAVVFDLNTPVVVSAGNSGPSSNTVGSPGSAYNVVTVGNVNDQNTVSRTDDTILSSSSRGPTGDGRRKPDISAPGTYIKSCNNNWESTTQFVDMTGTSMSTPMVAGSVLLILDYAASQWDNRAIKALLLNTADDMGITGPDNDYGYGYIELWHANFHRGDVFTGSLAATPEGQVEKFYRGPAYTGDKATMVWNRHVTYNDANEPTNYLGLSDLDLHWYDESTGASIDASTSSINNVEQVNSGGDYPSSIIKIEPFSSYPSGINSESYGLSTEEGFTAVSPPALSAALGVPSGTIGSAASFAVTTTVTDTGINAHSVSASLSLPSGFTIISGSNPQLLGTVGSSSSKSATWTVRAPSVGSSQSYTISTSISSSSYGESYNAADSEQITVGLISSVPDRLGNYKGNGVWGLDYNGNGQWDGTSTDRVFYFGCATDQPVVGDWNNDGKDELGNYKGNGVWGLDYNGNGQWDGDSIDRVFYFGCATDKPVVGDWNNDGKDELGNYKGNGLWALDYNGNGAWDGNSLDRAFYFGCATDQPVVGDWNGDGKDEVGNYKGNGLWALDHNGNGAWDGDSLDRAFYFGCATDQPVVGDWNGDGKDEVGNYKGNGLWALDYNGNGAWDGDSIDRVFYFGGATDKPVIGKW